MAVLHKEAHCINQDLNVHSLEIWSGNTAPPTQVIVDHVEGEAHTFIYPDGTETDRVIENTPLAEYLSFIPDATKVTTALISEFAAIAVHSYTASRNIKEN